MINEAINAIIHNNDADINIQECFDEMFSGVCNPILSGIFLSLLKMQEDNFENLLSAIKSARNSIKKTNLNIDYDFLIENICIDENPNYLDIGFAMDVVCASCEIGAVKSMPANFIYKKNSYDTMKAFELDAEKLNPEQFEEKHFLYSYISEDNPYLKYTQELFRVLPYETILNVVNHFLNPFNIQNCTVALLNEDKVEFFAKLCLELGYKNSVIFSGGNFPYISIEGQTSVSEAWKNKIFSYKVTPELLGVTPKSIDELKVDNSSHSAEIIKAVFENKLKDAAYDAIVVNSGFALYITKKAKSLMEGIELAKKKIDDGSAITVIYGLQS